MSYFMVDVESDGPIPGKYSMIEIGAVKVNNELNKTFFGKLRPITKNYKQSALDVTGYSREETMLNPLAEITMLEFSNWVVANNTSGKPIFISDNNGYDWMFTCWYLHTFVNNTNVFGWSSRRLGDLYCGLMRNTYARWKHLRKTKHTHNPVDDAMGNAEVLLHMKHKMGLKISLK